MAEMKIGKGKLWMDGSGRVSVPIIEPRKATAIVSPNGDVFGLVRMQRDRCDLSQHRCDLSQLMVEAERCRNDPKQLKKLAEAKKKAAIGKASSRAKLMVRILFKKQATFREAVQDLLRRGCDPKES
jgi:hypothetical protein